MGRDSDILTGLDLGTSKITVVVAEKTSDEGEPAHIIAVGQAPSRGLRKGMIVDLAQAVNSVSDAIADAESMLGGVKISHTTVAFSGLNVNCRVLHGAISLGKTPRAISREDLERVIETALGAMKIEPGSCVVHTIPARYSIDGHGGIENPLDMTGSRLEVDLTALVISTSVAQNVVNCVEKAGVSVVGLVLKSVAEALGTLTDDEKSMGATLVTLGGGTTSLSVFTDGHLKYAVEIPVGGDHITNDLSCVKKIPFAVAEELKKQISMDPDAECQGTVTIENRGRPQEIDKAEMADIIGSRLDELFAESLVPGLEQLQKAGLPTDVVMNGGVMLMPGMEKFAASYLKTPVHIGEPVLREQMQPGRNDCRYGAACGIIVYLMEKRKNPYAYMSAPLSLFKSVIASGKKSSIRSPKRASQSVFKNVTRTAREIFKELF